MGKLRMAAAALANMPLKKGLSQWSHVLHEEREKRRKLTEACRMIINAKAGRAYRQWAELCAAVNAKKAKIAAALSMLSPEGRAKRAAFRQIAWIRKRQLAMQRAGAGFRLAGCRHFMRKLQGQLEYLRKLRKGGAAIFLRKQRLCWNVWSEMAARNRDRQEKMKAAAMRITPEGRMLTAGFEAFVEKLHEAEQMRTAARRLLVGSRQKALNMWIEATFAAFHIASGLSEFERWRIRKAIRQWVGRAHIRKSLRRQIFTTALKGTSLRLLLTMMDQADTDDLMNAILARDPTGSTPLLIACKKGFIDVAEALISSGARCAEELGEAAQLLSEIVDTQDADGNSALHWAARKGHGDVAAALLEAGAKVDGVNAEEATPLHWAARKNNGELIGQLLQAGADASLKNKWGATALDQAFAFSQMLSVEVLQREEKRQGEGARASALAAMDAAKHGGKAPSPPPQGGASGGKKKTRKSPPKQWNEGAEKANWQKQKPPAGTSAKAPALIEQQNKRREAAEKRRQEALRNRDKQDDEKAKDQERRRRRQELELRLKELMDSVILSTTPQLFPEKKLRSGSAQLAREFRDKSPPKAKHIHDLGETIAQAREAECLITLVEAAEAQLAEAKKAAKAAKAAAAAAAAKIKTGGGKDDMDKQMRKMQKKLGL